MKAVNLVFGFVIFSIVLSMMFAATSDIMTENSADGAGDFDALSGEYEGFTEEFGDDKGTARGIIDAGKQGDVEGEDVDINIVSGALSGGRLAVNFISNFENIIHNATGDVNTGESYIDDRIIGVVIILIVIFLAFVLIHFARGFKTET